MASEGFQFKQFFIRHDRCAMKVGTDGVLLGAWAITPTNPSSQGRKIRILDVGTGSGLIARMMMQRFPEAEIEAIDVDEAAVEQARENGVNAYLSSLQEWHTHTNSSLTGRTRERLYHLIVSNPPYFQNSLKNPDVGRKTARHTDSLSYADLIRHSARLLVEKGQLALILPAESEQEITTLATSEGFALARITRVYSKESKPARRILIQFEKSSMSNVQSPIEENTLVLEDDQSGRSAAYRELEKDFYL